MTAVSQHKTSVGHVLSTSSWLDTHFEACREEYETMLAFAGFPPGVAVLDAGCGSGSFLASLTLNGARTVHALDIAQEHLSFLHAHGQGCLGLLACGVVSAVPLATDCVDGVWCANTLQFLDLDEAEDALREFARVVRPGGTVAVKDVDMTGFKVAPAPPLLGPHLADACITGKDVATESCGSLRGRELRTMMQQAGFRNVRQRSFLIERWGPLNGQDAAFWREWLPYLAGLAERRGVPGADLETWRQVSTPEAADTYIARDDFYGSELQVVCTGIAVRA